MVDPYKFILLVGFMSISTLFNAQNKVAFECFNNDVITNFKSDSYSKSFDDIKKQKEYELFLASQKGDKALKKFYNYFQELQLGLWTEKDQEIFFQTETENIATIHIVTTVERNLTAEQRKEIKKEVSKSSYKTAKYHQIGDKEFVFYFNIIDGYLHISDTEIINSLKIVR